MQALCEPRLHLWEDKSTGGVDAIASLCNHNVRMLRRIMLWRLTNTESLKMDRSRLFDDKLLNAIYCLLLLAFPHFSQSFLLAIDRKDAYSLLCSLLQLLPYSPLYLLTPMLTLIDPPNPLAFGHAYAVPGYGV